MEGTVEELHETGIPIRDIYMISLIFLETKGIPLGNNYGYETLRRDFLIRIKDFERVCNLSMTEDQVSLKCPWYKPLTRAGNLKPLPSVEDSVEMFNKLVKNKNKEKPKDE